MDVSRVRGELKSVFWMLIGPGGKTKDGYILLTSRETGKYP